MAKKETLRKEKPTKNKAGKYCVTVVLEDEATKKEVNIVFLKFSEKPQKKKIDDLIAKVLKE